MLIYVRATGAVDNTACRDFCGLDTLAASLVLRRLRDRGLLEKRGSGSRTYYILVGIMEQPDRNPEQSELPLEQFSGLPVGGRAKEGPNQEGSGPPPHGQVQMDAACNPELATFPPELATFPPELATLLGGLKGRVSAKALREGICRLCTWAPLTGDQLAILLKKDRHYLRNKYLIPMVRDGLLRFRYPESAKHPHQAYVTAKPGEH
ncbi:hypothetical protein [Castellaniella sp. MT123]|uniref:hypothetical protein n=1 Tax=Castellaniella sp. MT123 TaxID=3140381 RepID=UPI0031F3E163